MSAGGRSVRALALLAVFAAAGCASAPAHRSALPTSDRASLEIREGQTRRYEGLARSRVMAAVAQALQDSGFQLQAADAEVGILTATAERTEGREAHGLVRALFWYPYLIPFRGLLPKRTHVVVELTATLAEVDGGVRVRLNALSRVLDKAGRLKDTGTLDDPRAFQELFSRIDKALFLERERL